jgi:colanic acid biosynthesis glycosyl transferase WcaI
MTRIVLWTPNYAPELLGIPPLVTDAAEGLARRGHEVDVVTAVPNYPERVIRPEYKGALYRSACENGVRVHRSWVRVRPQERFVDKALYEASFALVSLPRVVRRLRRTDCLVCVVPSLAAAAAAALLPGRGRLVLWVQDLVSAAAATVDGVRGLGAARYLESLAARRADRIVVCSPGFSKHLVELGANPALIETVYNWVDPAEITMEPARVNGHARFLYAGNLGYTQGFQTLVEAARLAEVKLDIVGDGNAAADVRALANGHVAVRPPVARHGYPALLASADVHVVVQLKIAAGANLPSKIASYLASGRPIIASIGAETPAAALLRASGAAVLVEPERPDVLAAAMRMLAADPVLRSELGTRGRAFAERELGRDGSLARLERAILG